MNQNKVSEKSKAFLMSLSVINSRLSVYSLSFCKVERAAQFLDLLHMIYFTAS